MSRQPTWDLACRLQAEMFDAVAKASGAQRAARLFPRLRRVPQLEIRCRHRRVETADGGIDCRGGHTQIGKVLCALKAMPPRRFTPSSIGDAVGGAIDDLAEKAGRKRPMACRCSCSKGSMASPKGRCADHGCRRGVVPLRPQFRRTAGQSPVVGGRVRDRRPGRAGSGAGQVDDRKSAGRQDGMSAIGGAAALLFWERCSLRSCASTRRSAHFPATCRAGDPWGRRRRGDGCRTRRARRGAAVGCGRLVWLHQAAVRSRGAKDAGQALDGAHRRPGDGARPRFRRAGGLVLAGSHEGKTLGKMSLGQLLELYAELSADAESRAC